MSITLYHHPYSRAVSVVPMLEATGVPYTIASVDMLKGEHKSKTMLSYNPMGKLPVLIDGDLVLTEAAAIGLYLADRYAAGRLAPAVDAPERAAYLRWILFGPSVVEPAAMANLEKWNVNPQAAGWGTFETMVTTLEHAIGDGPWMLGAQFSMADIVLGGTLRYMLGVKSLPARPTFVAYAERYAEQPAVKKADALQAEFLAKL